MSKKWVALLLVVCIGLAGGVGFMRMNADTEGPEIVFTSEAPSVYRSDMSNEELLTGVTATDRKDGDVSSSLTVESVYEIDDSHVAVTYTAKDNSNNITKQKYEMEMDPSDAGKASEDTSAFGEKTDNADAAATTGVDAEQSENPDTADHAEENADEAAAEKEKQEAEANTMPDQNPRIYLTDYLIKVPVGTSVDLLSYVSEIKDDSDDAYALWRKVQITGEVNSAVPGTYKCTYYVIDSQNNISNNAVLTVIVE